MSDFKFAAFIMTYERPEILKETIHSLLKQTFAPEKILIVDNSESFATKVLIENLGIKNVVYYRVGYNAGPAGAAKIGLQILAEEGYQWIYWGDDDDPPNFQDSFEKIFKLIGKTKLSIGIIGEVGQFFNTTKGELIRVKDEDLLRNDYIVVDSVAGNQSMIVNAKVVKNGVFPDDTLFFGFEELDFCLKVKNAGFYVLAHCELMYEARKLYNRIGLKRPVYIKKKNLNRVYYSTRNSIVILQRNNFQLAILFQFFKNSFKCLYGFRYGIAYGFENLKAISLGVFHAFVLRVGKIE